MIGLSKRLKTIAELCNGDTIADIGCDHGRLGVWMLQNGLCKRVIAIDVSEKCIEKARRLATFVGVSDQMDCRVGDGLNVLHPGEADSVVISGMGGTSIQDILRDRQDMLRSARVVLQPQTSKPELREWLGENGFVVRDEKVVLDRRRYYDVWLVDCPCRLEDRSKWISMSIN